MNKFLTISVVVLGCAIGAFFAIAETNGADEAAKSANPRVAMETSMGKFVIELNPEKAPITVENFLAYVDSGHYSGVIFHRVIKGFMVQGGSIKEDMTPKPNRAPIKNEADNGLKNLRGTISMARTGVVDSATSQFFVNTVDNGNLDHRGKTQRGWGYAVFGKVVEGMDVVDAIESTPTGAQAPFRKDSPLTKVVILKAYRL